MCELSPPVLYELGFVPAIEWLAEQVQKQQGLTCTVTVGTKAVNLEGELNILLFKAVRELLMNVVKHAGAATATIAVAAGDDAVAVTVEDDGAGFDVEEVRRRLRTGRGFGLFSIRERLSYLKGRLDIRSAPGQGTRVRLTIPAAGGEREHHEDQSTAR
jgi:signal transduction histidine kinase